MKKNIRSIVLMAALAVVLVAGVVARAQKELAPMEVLAGVFVHPENLVADLPEKRGDDGVPGPRWGRGGGQEKDDGQAMAENGPALRQKSPTRPGMPLLREPL